MLEKNLKLAEKAAREAGIVVMSYFKTSSYDIKDKSFDNPVTTADHEANQIIKDILFKDTMTYGWLSEETVDSKERLKKGLCLGYRSNRRHKRVHRGSAAILH